MQFITQKKEKRQFFKQNNANSPGQLLHPDSPQLSCRLPSLLILLSPSAVLVLAVSSTPHFIVFPLDFIQSETVKKSNQKHRTAQTDVQTYTQGRHVQSACSLPSQTPKAGRRASCHAALSMATLLQVNRRRRSSRICFV